MKESKSVKSNALRHLQENGHFPPFKFAKLLDPEASWDKDQLGDVLHWIRQVVALFNGLLWGAIPVVGGIWTFIFLAISTGIIYGYYAMILKIDEEEFGVGMDSGIQLGPLLICAVSSIWPPCVSKSC
ncbi:hypothetical protein ES319_A07G108300v1 [Gossypium barbadense]|uniref:Rab5-interacting protein n=1 Tax=Gossypium barbadense TaxID=3634 RepID=A0A5J5V1U0_GOSBA|nr:hypothetical protein ES319_A07G108300v1 [Gossypium barbadense]